MSAKPLVPLVPRTDFGKPPPGYVPGLGRGATGFTTRSDIGPARPAVGGGESGGPPSAARPGKEGEKEDEKGDYSDSNFDAFSGFNERLFAGGPYDADDLEADSTYEAIDKHMDDRRKRRREEREKKEMEEYRKKRPKIQEQFRDLKKHLGELKETDWDSIPEPMDFTRKNKNLSKKSKTLVYTPLPDNILAGGAGMGATVGSIDPKTGLTTPLAATPVGGSDQVTIGRTRDKLLGMKLDRVADSVTGRTVVDPKGYLTDLNSIKVSSEDQVSDIKKARLLLKSVITTNPKHAPGWIAAARFERDTGKIVAARDLITKGCEVCPTNEDVWLEASTMFPPKSAKAMLAKAVRHIPTSIKIWMRAFDLEEDLAAKKAVLRRALEFVPTSVKLWKTAIELENEDDARILLGRAVELVPQSVELWLALARLETYENARKVLNRARTAIPTEPSIWITAAKLEEANNALDNVDQIIQKAVQSLAKQQVMISRDTWLSEAEAAELSGAIHTCQAIVKHTVGLGVEEQDRKNTWLNDAEAFQAKGSIGTARAILSHMLTVFPSKSAIWIKAAQLERQCGTKEALEQLLKRAVQYCPQEETLWLMAAKEKWLAGDVSGARLILKSANQANPNSEEVWLAAVKLESENQEFDRARGLLAQARERASSARVWMKSALLERQLGNIEGCKDLLQKGIEKFPTFHKLWIMLAQYYEGKQDSKEAREVYKNGCRSCPTSPDLWMCYARLETSEQQYGKARAILETARQKIPKNPQLWLAAIRVELQAKNEKVAQQLQSKALQECPDAGLLWAHAIATDPRPTRKSRSFDALKRCNEDAHVACAVAKLFWFDRKIKKARNWFQRAVTADPDLGDAWAFYYKFELEHGDEKTQEALLKRCVEADPHHGELWCAVSKNPTNIKLKTEAILKQVVEGIREIF